ncbi:hypothetical protein GCM10028805_18170 [Spirosoma harenae]
MITRLTLIHTFVIAITLLTSACKDKETATPSIAGEFSFSAPNSDFRAPAEIAFTASDDVADATYLWSFGDNTTSTEKSPKKVYTTGGIRTVTLTVKSGDQTKTVNKTIEIQAPYTKVRIMKTTILKASPAYPDGTGWDITNTSDIYRSGGPDVYILGRFDGDTYESYYNSIKTNITSANLTNGSVSWDHSPNGFLVASTEARLKVPIKFYLRDADENSTLWGASYESMGVAQLLFSDLTTIGNKYPASVEVSGISTATGNAKYLNDNLKLKFDLKWE